MSKSNRPLRIVHCANFNAIRLKGCYLASMGYKLTNGLTRLGHQVLCYADRDMARVFGLFGHKLPWSLSAANENFYQFCLNTAPDALVLGHADTITQETLLKIRERLPNLKVLQWNVDNINPDNAEGVANIARINGKINAVDFTLITTADKTRLAAVAAKEGAVGFIPNPVDGSAERAKAFEQESLPYDVYFASSPNRKRDFAGTMQTAAEIAADLEKELSGLKLLFPNINAAGAAGADYLNQLASSAMVLNVSMVNTDYLYSSDRMAHAMGSGCLTLIDRRTGFNDIFAEDEAGFYTTKEELYDKIRYYAVHREERRKVAENGWRRSFELFNETKVASYVASLLTDTFNPKDYPFPTIINRED